MKSRLAGWAAIIAGLSLVLFIGMVIQWAEPEWRHLLLFAYGTVAVLAAAASAAGGLPRWWTIALVAALLGGTGLLLWPREAYSWNYLFGPLLLAGAAAAAIALIVSRVRAQSGPDGETTLGVMSSLLRPARMWAAAVALAAFGMLLLFSFNVAGLGFLIGSGALVIATGNALVRSRRRLLAFLCAALVTPLPLLAMQLVLVATDTVGPDRRYEIPAAYRGWVIIQEATPECPPLGTDDGTLVFSIDQRGCGCTSGTGPNGWSHWTYVAVAADGGRTMLPDTGWGGGGLIWAGFSGSGTIHAHPYSGFFVGTEDELQRSWTDQRSQETRCLQRT
ncbi:MAG TPA: hypothetical protein VGR85_00230 [Candidatus Limnocylindria bacterium]|nr:hypothetical protein [Candidatus Limnocylindria bacterium]